VIRPTTAAWFLAAAAIGACTIVPAEEAGVPGSPGMELPPPGHGTLREDEISIRFVSDRLQVQVTPLAEAILVATTPDTYRRLAGLAADRAPETQAGQTPPTLFLVSFFSNDAGVEIRPEDLQMVSRGLRSRPAEILPLTPGWGGRRLQQRVTESAIYVFTDAVDLEAELVVVYGLEEDASWANILPRIRAERNLARARAGVGG